MPRAKKKITVKQPPWQGDHGPQTAAQMAGARITEPDDMKGNNPNRVGQKKRENTLKKLMDDGVLTMAQYQAGERIQLAWLKTEKLSSGTGLKERVDSSPRPDVFSAAQVEAHAELRQATKSIPYECMEVVERICCLDEPIEGFGSILNQVGAKVKLILALDILAKEAGNG